MTDYIGESLMLVKQFCRTMNVVVIIVAHPTKAINQTGGRITSLADIEGSMNWFNKCDNGLIVVRDSGHNAAKVISAKVREIGAGKVGTLPFPGRSGERPVCPPIRSGVRWQALERPNTTF